MPVKKQSAKTLIRHLFVLIVIVTIFFILYSLVDIIPPDAMTRSSIGETFVRIEIYAKRHKALPPSLDVLPKREGYANRATDAWKQPLKYEYNVLNGKITLTGYGKSDNNGKKTIISKSYYATREDGSFWVGVDPNWIIHADVETCPRPADGQRNAHVQELCKEKITYIYPREAR